MFQTENATHAQLSTQEIESKANLKKMIPVVLLAYFLLLKHPCHKLKTTFWYELGHFINYIT